MPKDADTTHHGAHSTAAIEIDAGGPATDITTRIRSTHPQWSKTAPLCSSPATFSLRRDSMTYSAYTIPKPRMAAQQARPTTAAATVETPASRPAEATHANHGSNTTTAMVTTRHTANTGAYTRR
eukprot:TRINITY_DN14368_c0_g1_i2.p2 TRINITY_DN14368_c0_g1~~TRINITY_DN14368_c0_g1_i2.p2  ORF type:complete len:125 (+),score=12.91 TRINITY_DN14368_c0_g1_i2:146-520(+)